MIRGRCVDRKKLAAHTRRDRIEQSFVEQALPVQDGLIKSVCVES